MQQKIEQFFHPWHSLSSGDHVPKTVNGIIEITQGSKAKYELDKQTGFLRLDRVLASDLRYPFHYGFIPRTFCEDNDPLDILILCSEPLLPLSIVEATVLGAVKMLDDGEQDDKIIAVATNDPFNKQSKELADINPKTLATIQTFFQEYKVPEHKTVVVERFLERKEAYPIIERALELYSTVFSQ